MVLVEAVHKDRAAADRRDRHDVDRLGMDEDHSQVRAADRTEDNALAAVGARRSLAAAAEAAAQRSRAAAAGAGAR